MSAITFFVPLPPVRLRANSRYANHQGTRRLRREYSHDVLAAFLRLPDAGRRWRKAGCPWPRARLTLTWRQCAPVSDEDNALASCKALLDCLKVAPANSYDPEMYYLGLFEDDSPEHLTINFADARVSKRTEQGVVVTVEALSDSTDSTRPTAVRVGSGALILE